MAHRTRLATLLSFLLCGVLCPATAFAVRPRPVSAEISLANRDRQQHLDLVRRNSPNLYANSSDQANYSSTALSVASGGATSDDGPSSLEKFRAFTSKNFFLLGMCAAVSLARAFPHVRICYVMCRCLMLYTRYSSDIDDI